MLDAKDEALLVAGIDKLRLAASRLIQSVHDREEVVQNSCLRLARALAKGRSVVSPDAFLLSMVKEEAASWLRTTRNWSRRGWARDLVDQGPEAQDDGGGLSEAQVGAVPGVLPPPFGGWLADLILGASDTSIADRDGVTEAAVRKRWSRLRSHFLAPGVAEKILDMLVTKGASGASRAPAAVETVSTSPSSPLQPQLPPPQS